MAKAKKKAPPKAQLLFRFKVTLIDSTPPIWRRIVVPNGTLDDLHEHIQTGMGWTNSHLHRFEIAKRIYGERELLCDGWAGDEHIIESRTTRLTSLFSQAPAPFRFGYLYDFGDDWKQ